MGHHLGQGRAVFAAGLSQLRQAPFNFVQPTGIRLQRLAVANQLPPHLLHLNESAADHFRQRG
jgi:hypothetical protein